MLGVMLVLVVAGLVVASVYDSWSCEQLQEGIADEQAAYNFISTVTVPAFETDVAEADAAYVAAAAEEAAKLQEFLTEVNPPDYDHPLYLAYLALGAITDTMLQALQDAEQSLGDAQLELADITDTIGEMQTALAIKIQSGECNQHGTTVPSDDCPMNYYDCLNGEGAPLWGSCGDANYLAETCSAP